MAPASRLHILKLCVSLCLSLPIAPEMACAQLTGVFRSDSGSTAIYEYHLGNFHSVLLPADVTVSFSDDTPTSTLTATIHQPIIGDIPEGPDFEIVNEFPLVVTGSSGDGRRFHGDLLGTQYLFDWEFEPTADGQLLWNGQVYWAGGRYELTTISDARFFSIPDGDLNESGLVDGRDFLIWQRGESPNPLSAGDLADWQANYGVGPLIAQSMSVPEPATAMLAATAMAMLGWRRQ